MAESEMGSIEREIHVDASPDVVFEVITSPEHLREWWPDDADLEPTPGFEGHLVFSNGPTPEDVHLPKVTVVDAVPGRLFSFRWVYPEDEAAGETNALLVTFTLEPSGGGTHVRMVESGWHEKDWTAEELEREHQDHISGWDHFIPRLGEYVARLVQAS